MVAKKANKSQAKASRIADNVHKYKEYLNEVLSFIRYVVNKRVTFRKKTPCINNEIGPDLFFEYFLMCIGFNRSKNFGKISLNLSDYEFHSFFIRKS